ncbi:hypothetical protein FHR69_005096 [Pseudomonas umsongensis]|uniref:Uncharacterized protein n=1 Tax=Pseudomonas umsongensis TaxID=198618 RepID=A0ACC5MK92_9PSED|nr:hypothetical protein [Pseudomonas umsongensis]
MPISCIGLRGLPFLMEYISVSAVTAAGGFAFTASHFRKAGMPAQAKVTKALLPLHSVPRLGSACPHSGIAPGGRRHRPSMAGGGYRGILAAVPPAQRLRSASGKGAADPKPKQKPQQDQKIAASLRSTAPTGKCVHVRSGRPVGRLAFDFDAPPPREAEWRFCAVGNPAWMPG